MKYRKELYGAAVCFLLALLCFAAGRRSDQEALAERIAPHLLRFHILADSNSAADQAMKLEVRDLLLGLLAEGTADADGLSEKEAICRYVTEHRRELEKAAEDYMAARGYQRNAAVCITRCRFPTKCYGDIVLPCGTYDAVQVTLGKGRGRNWWCLLYPRLCFVDASHAAVPEESKNELQSLVGEDDFAALLMQDGVKIQIRFRLPELLAGLWQRGDGSLNAAAPDSGSTAPSDPT